ncbi:hypothetical protein LSH36_467g04063 [Paralvinella palmiformis]|uniref:G-protein coupled receptors family 1 profile domain-containing protein n=1 Tax=Paralvinella palmiformis TaxID=53620 RepID=A0AAD9JA84_9ANNE|nr:hypothetical protein LSH36_467g04063 [Paralvinella palmiformis]
MESATDTLSMCYQNQTTGLNTLTKIDIVVVIGELIIMVISLFGNALVIAAVHRYRRLRNTTNKLVCSLALSDIGVGLCFPFLILFNLLPQIKEHRMACIFRYQLIICMVSISQFTLVLVSVDRFVAIHFPLRYHALLSRNRVTAMIVSVWIYSVAIAVIPMFGMNEWQSYSWAKCELENILPAPYSLTLTLHFFATSLIMVCLYARVFILARRHAQRIRLECNGYCSNLKYKTRLSKATMTLCLVLGVFILSWLPFYVTIVAYEVRRLRGGIDPSLQRLLINLRMMTSIIGLANSMWNPMIYAGKNRDFRLAFKRLLYMDMRGSPEFLHRRRSSIISNPAFTA